MFISTSPLPIEAFEQFSFYGIATVEKSVEARQVANIDAKLPVGENLSIYLTKGS